MFSSASAAAVERFSAVFRAGVAIPIDDLGDTSLDTGFGFELSRDIELGGIKSDVDLNYFALDVGVIVSRALSRLL